MIRVISQISSTILVSLLLEIDNTDVLFGPRYLRRMLSGLKEHDHLSFYTSPLLYPIKVHDKELHIYFPLEYIRYYDG